MSNFRLNDVFLCDRIFYSYAWFRKTLNALKQIILTTVKTKNN